jgi:hypothetical protein
MTDPTDKMSCVQRLSSMYTNLNLGALVVYKWMPERIKDIIRASTLLILIVVASTWITGDVNTIYTELFDSFTILEISAEWKNAIVFAADVLLHVVPVFIVGLPKTRISLLMGSGLLLTWYSMVRERIHQIYSPSVPADRGVCVAITSAFCGAACM